MFLLFLEEENVDGLASLVALYHDEQVYGLHILSRLSGTSSAFLLSVTFLQLISLLGDFKCIDTICILIQFRRSGHSCFVFMNQNIRLSFSKAFHFGFFRKLFKSLVNFLCMCAFEDSMKAELYNNNVE